MAVRLHRVSPAAKNPTPGFMIWRSHENDPFALFFLCATPPWDNRWQLSNEPQVIQIPSHNLHASQIPMQQERTF